MIIFLRSKRKVFVSNFFSKINETAHWFTKNDPALWFSKKILQFQQDNEWLRNTDPKLRIGLIKPNPTTEKYTLSAGCLATESHRVSS